jgi:hypothetical protein
MTKLLLSILMPASLCLACAPSPGIQQRELLGAWTSGGPSFDFDIRDSTVLYEFDMQEHPYLLEDDVLVVDFGSTELGIQRKRILALGTDSLVLQDVRTGTSTTFRRVQ